jgi:glycosyltransferase involved in cell wall biosynthesis
MVENAGAVLITVEAAFGNRPHAITEANNPHHLQLRTNTEIWHKENLINLGIERLPQDWEYVAWIDADIQFADPNWVNETLNQLQHYDVVQMFSKAQDLGPRHEPFQVHNGFMYSYLNSLCDNTKDYSQWHPGFAWAARRSAINALGGLIDIAILGAGDRHMAHALIGTVKKTIHSKLNQAYAKELILWENRAERYIRRNVGYVPGLILHYWHGKKRDRRYADRWKIIIDNNYNPHIDLKEDWQGLWQLTEHNFKLRDDIRAYFRSRNEDSIDLDDREVRI